jgi:hypothetical protein
MDPAERQQAFENASKLLFDAWPQAYSGQRVSDQWPQCQMFIQHVLSLNEHYLKDAKIGEGKYKGTAELAELMSHVGWWVSLVYLPKSDILKHAGIFSRFLISTI